MKFDFDTFEFAGLIAPGSVVVVAIVLLWPQLVHGVEAAVFVTVGIMAAYVGGHLVAAIANLAGPVFEGIDAQDLEASSVEEWCHKGYMLAEQRDRFKRLVGTVLFRTGLGDRDLVERKILVKQMYLAAVKQRGQRLDTFKGLNSLSRGLTVAFCVAVALCLIAHVYVSAALCAIAVVLAGLRVRKFNETYHRELIQEFLLLDGKGHDQSPSESKPSHVEDEEDKRLFPAS